MDSDVALLSAPAIDFHFDSGCSTPYISAPSSPARIPDFFRSESQIIDKFCRQFCQLPSFKDAELSLQPRDEKQRAERSRGLDGEAEFAFDFSGRSYGQDSVFAEELFDHGKIKPLNSELKTELASIEFSDTNKTKQSSPYLRSPSTSLFSRFTHSRGRGGEDKALPPRKSRRSVSLVQETVSFWDVFPFSKLYRKWKLKDLLFRSKSEGRSVEAEAANGVVVRSSSLRSVESILSTESTDSLSGSNRRRTGADAESSFRSNVSYGSNRRRRARSVSAHELHYTMNRAVSEERRRRTFLPYKRGLLGCLGLGNPTVSRVGSMTRG